MRNCIRIPRIIVPRKDFRHWAVIACDQFTSDRAYWDRVAQEVRNRPSTLQFILPEIDLGEDDETRFKEAGEWMRAALVEEWTRIMPSSLSVLTLFWVEDMEHLLLSLIWREVRGPSLRSVARTSRQLMRMPPRCRQ